MIAAILPIIRVAAPWLLAVAVAIGVWLHGYHTADEARIYREAQIKAESDQLIGASVQRNNELQAQFTKSNNDIEEQASATRQVIESLSDRNSKLLADLLRRDRAGSHCRTMPDNSTSAAVGDDSGPGAESFLESAGASLIVEAKRADSVSESLRACQAYVARLQEIFK